MLVIDRIEGSLAVVEMGKGHFDNIPLERIQGNARDGALLKDCGNGTYEVDEEATSKRTQEMKARFGSLFH